MTLSIALPLVTLFLAGPVLLFAVFLGRSVEADLERLRREAELRDRWADFRTSLLPTLEAMTRAMQAIGETFALVASRVAETLSIFAVTKEGTSDD